MKIITKYVADDGKEFATETECCDHEKSINLLSHIAENVPDRDVDEIYDGLIYDDIKDYILNNIDEIYALVK